ncbi:MAG TPA: hypothetical protein VN325_37810 [Steroidobacteraceae bacterium]|nr:hypothetical protein [Steroidobacteraceae bacterium]
MVHLCRSAIGIGLLASLFASMSARPGDSARSAAPEPMSPAAFFPGGMLGLQLGSPWGTVKKSPALNRLTCEPSTGAAEVFDEICYFRTSGRVAGAEIHDGFIVRKGDEVILIGTGITIKNPDDPLAETVMRDFASNVHAKFQQTGSDVLFVNLPARHMSAQELQGFSRTAPVLLVELEPKGNELAVFYGYLAPVNAFSALASN